MNTSSQPSLISDLLSLARDAEVSTSSLLFAAYEVAKRLADGETSDWIAKEIYGYPREQIPPAYRTFQRNRAYQSPYHNWILVEPPKDESPNATFRWKMKDLENTFKTCRMGQYVGLDTGKAAPHRFFTKMLFLSDITPRNIFELYAVDDFEKIFGSVKKAILDWAIKMELSGNIGTGKYIVAPQSDDITPSTVVHVSQTQEHVMSKKEISFGDHASLSNSPVVIAKNITGSANSTNSGMISEDAQNLFKELNILRIEMQKNASEAKHFSELNAVAEAEEAAKNGDSAGAKQFLKAAGKWTLDIASKIGTNLVGSYIKGSTGVG